MDSYIVAMSASNRGTYTYMQRWNIGTYTYVQEQNVGKVFLSVLVPQMRVQKP